jgi:hypothetical protein
MGVYGFAAYRDKKVVGVFVRFRAPLQYYSKRTGTSNIQPTRFFIYGVRTTKKVRKTLT